MDLQDKWRFNPIIGKVLLVQTKKKQHQQFLCFNPIIGKVLQRQNRCFYYYIIKHSLCQAKKHRR